MVEKKRGGESKEEEEYINSPRSESCVEKASVDGRVCIETNMVCQNLPDN